MGSAIELSDITFEQEVIRSTLPVLVDFYAPWCGPCRNQLPIVEDLSIELAGKAKICKINVDENPQKADEYGVSGIPALLVFKNGGLVQRMAGLHSKSQLNFIIEKYL